MISCDCPNCGKQFRLNDERAGKRARCRDCGASFVVLGGAGGDAPGAAAERHPIVLRYRTGAGKLWDALLSLITTLPAYEILGRDRDGGSLSFRNKEGGLLITAFVSEEETVSALSFAFDDSQVVSAEGLKFFKPMARQFKITPKEAQYRFIIVAIQVNLDRKYKRVGAGGCLGALLLLAGTAVACWLASWA